ncbi:MAG: branched-chain amino acid ABC transporter permease [Candidatus Tectomicrobia bacterium]|uniref:Branched-chain amino acid ABC transporter permease n=1 Tax=Tectimicrobiota bacterium TaxID=2528274 RepID=A0A937VZD8_UNCTE|nr:branched-chain amino acid ABC transporter permease [Candidatus Tectomicrobia bacterium]
MGLARTAASGALLMRHRWQSFALAHRQRLARSAGVLALLVFPFVDLWWNLQLVNAITDASVFVILALGLNIVVGYAGLLDLGYAAFFAIGAYTTGILTWPPHGLELNFWVAMLLSVPVAAVFGIILGAPTLRVRGDYLAIITLAFGEIVPIAFRNLWHIDLRIGPWTLLENFNLTNGPQGLNPVGRPRLFGYEFGFEPMPWYFLMLAVGLLVILAKSRLEHSRLGRAWMAIREDEVAADCMGVDPIKTKLLAFALGASFAGLAGAVYAAKLQAIFPELFRFQVSIMLLCIVIMGGMGNLKGVILGGMCIMFFDRVVLAQSTQWVRALGHLLGSDVLMRADLSLWRWFFFGLTLIIVMVLRPEGLWPGARRVGAAPLRKEAA